jgi:uncharacterized protein (DUF362 family)
MFPGNPSSCLNRRDFLKNAGRGIAGIAVLGERAFTGPSRQAAPSTAPRISGGRLFKKIEEPASVSLVKGGNRRENVFQALKLIENEILSSIGDKRIMIKPNVVTPINQLGSLHVDAMRGILDFFAPHYRKPITVGEAACLDTIEGFRRYGYYALEKEYNVKLVDLNTTAFQHRYVIDKDNAPVPIRIISAYLDPDLYIISAAPMKTHNIVLVTLSLKNILLGAPLNDYTTNDKALMHTSPTTTANDICHFNMFHLAQEVFPDLAVIDGFQAMEGKGPAWGTPVDARVAVASRDAVAADTLATKVMGFDVNKVLYLKSMAEAGMGQGDLAKIRILGAPLENCLYHFKLDDKTAEIYNIRS